MPETTLTDDERDIIGHSLGLDYPNKVRRNRGPYRNYYCASVTDARLSSLAVRGLMTRGHTINDGTAVYYFVTAAGAAAVGSKLPKE